MLTDTDYRVYCAYKKEGCTSLEAFNRLRRPDANKTLLTVASIIGSAILLLGLLVSKRLPKAYRDIYIRSTKLWVIRPSSDTPIQLPLYSAIRAVRKRGWWFSATEPKRTISRKEAFKILILGDKPRRQKEK